VRGSRDEGNALALFAYIARYGLTGKAAARAIRMTGAADVPLLLNLGGDTAPAGILDAVDGLLSEPMFIMLTARAQLSRVAL
jgi:hypothetical protein